MSAKERITRPQPERAQPIRSWSKLFAAPNASAPPSDAASRGAARPERSPSLNDVVARSVELGYRVIDEYIQQGQKVAQRVSDRSYGPEALGSDIQEVTTRIAQQASDFAALWFELIQLGTAGSLGSGPLPRTDGVGAAPQAPSAAGAAAPANHPTPRAPEPAGRTRVRIEVASQRPTEVSLDLRPEAADRPLLVQALHAVDPEKPRLTDVAIERAGGDGLVTVRIRVPTSQPAGVYNGLVIDEESNRPVGTLSLRVAPE